MQSIYLLWRVINLGVLEKYLLKPQPTQPTLLEEIRSTLARLNAARLWFDSESDPDLIEACVYQIESLEASYRYLLKQAKRAGLTNDVFAVPDEDEGAFGELVQATARIE